jgi:hypothetical protein
MSKYGSPTEIASIERKVMETYQLQFSKQPRFRPTVYSGLEHGAVLEYWNVDVRMTETITIPLVTNDYYKTHFGLAHRRMTNSKSCCYHFLLTSQ